MKRIKLSHSLEDMSFMSRAELVSPKGHSYKAYPQFDSVLGIIEDILNDAKELYRTMKVTNENAPTLHIGLLPEYGKCVFFTEKTDRFYCDLKSNEIFSFENDGFTEKWSYFKN